MSATTTRLAHAQAVSLAWELVALLSPYCERIEVLGSIRRNRPTCGDIELLAVPKILPSMLHDMFGDEVSHVPALDMLDNAVQDLLAEGTLQQRQPRKWGPKYKAALYREFPVDLYIVTPPAQWGYLSVIRTGSNLFCKRLVTPREKGGWLPSGLFCSDGALWSTSTGVVIPTPEETDLFAAIGQPYCPPERREV